MATSIDFDSNIPYYIQLIEALKGGIKRGAWQAGERLPGEHELCATYGISRTVVRQTLHELELEGLIIRRKGRGSFVVEPKISESLAQKLTGFHQDMTERGHRPVTHVLRLAVVPASKRVATYLALDADAPVIELERLRAVKGESIVLVTSYLPHALCPELEQIDFTDRSLYETLETQFGLIIARGRRHIEAVPANAKEAELLDIAAGAPLLMLDSVSYLADGTPIEYYHALHRGDRSRFDVELVRIREQGIVRDTLATTVSDLPPSSVMAS